MANVTIYMPDIGDDKPVEVIELLIAIGDEVAEESGLITIESDKATMDVPAPSAGTVVELKVAIGDMVKVGDEIAVLKSAEADQASNPPASPEEGQADVSSEDSTEAPAETAEAAEVETPVVDDKTNSRSSSEKITIQMPDIGDEKPVEVIELLVTVGDEISVETGLITIESDKATMDVPTPSAGTIVELKVAIGDQVNAGDEIAVIQQTGATQPSSPSTLPATNVETTAAEQDKSGGSNSAINIDPPAPPPEPAAAPTQPPQTTPVGSGRVYSSPAVRYIAREWGVDLREVAGTGRKGRILKSDMQAYVRDRLAEKAGGGALPATPQVDHAKFGSTRSKPLSKIRKVSAGNLHASWVNVPHVTQHYRADITALEAARKGHNLLADSKLTPLAYLLKASAVLLKEMEDFNSSLSADGGSLILKDYVHIGFACDTPNGLVVPVIQNVDQKSLSELAIEAGELAAKARDGKLMPKQMQGGCFTISSLGHIGSNNNGPDYFSPIVNAPQVAILGVSRSKTEPQWNGQEFEPRLMLPLSLSYDHRVIDGVAAAKFANRLGEQLADWKK